VIFFAMPPVSHKPSSITSPANFKQRFRNREAAKAGTRVL
jgi:hypothetical protein